MTQLDLVVLVADTDAEWTIRTLLEKRSQALGIRPIQFKIINESGHDPAVFKRGAEVLAVYHKIASHALVLLDYEGCGQDTRSKTLTVDEVEAHIAQQMIQRGWQAGAIGVIALNPELEVWVWSRSKHVAEVLGFNSDDLTHILENVERMSNGKPQRPKEALKQALKIKNRPHNADIFRKLAEKVSLAGHEERAFQRLLEFLQSWFPTEKG